MASQAEDGPIAQAKGVHSQRPVGKFFLAPSRRSAQGGPRSVEQRKVGSLCSSCNKQNHWAGGPECPKVKNGTDKPRAPPPPRKPSGPQKRKKPRVVNWCNPVFTKDAKMAQEPPAKHIHQIFVVDGRSKTSTPPWR